MEDIADGSGIVSLEARGLGVDIREGCDVGVVSVEG